jgi:hypothetical protein
LLETTKLLVEGGAAAVRALPAEQREENLHLEFKTLQDQSGTTLLPADKKLIVKAVCALANAEGGTVVVGVKTRKANEVDVAHDVKTIEDVQALANRVQAALADHLSPQHPGVTSHPLLDDGGPSGFLVIDVPPSDLRPHMSTAKDEGRYYRRNMTGVAVMTHGEVRDLMLAPRSAVLKPTIRLASTGRNTAFFPFQVRIGIRNEGRAAAIAPYLEADTRLLSPETLLAKVKFVVDDKPNGRRRFVSTPETIIYAGDEVDLFAFHTGVFLRAGQWRDAADLVDTVLESPHAQSFQFTANHPDRTEMDDSARPSFEIGVGAMNAEHSTLAYRPERRHLLETMRPYIVRYGYNDHA